LGAGSVIHAVEHAMHHNNEHGDPQDIRYMGALKGKMPRTYVTFFAACLAIAGIPGFSGFFSKDEIIWQSFASGHTVIGILAIVAAGLTAFYMFRLLFLTFFGSWRGKAKTDEHLKESPSVMTVPLIVLGVLSVIGGWIMIPPALFGGAQFEHFLSPVFKIAEEASTHVPIHSAALEYGIMVISVLAALTGIWFAYRWYIVDPARPKRFAAKAKGLHTLLLNKYYVDEIYAKLVIKPTVGLGQGLWKGFDVPVIDGAVNGTAKLIGWIGSVTRLTQTGLIGNYALAIAVGVVLMVSWMLWN
jgi:NADH-quinone oxidoreductase subunit L